jgi:ferrous iron transport protein A
MTVKELTFRKKTTILRFLEEHLEKKLLSMGIMPGSSVEVLRKAPFGGAFYVKIDGLILALRNNEASSIEVKNGEKNI